jgi:hypothetical protein
MRQLPALALTALALIVFPSAATAQKAKGIPGAGKTPGVCGMKILPLVVGNVWKFGQVASTMTLPENMARLAPPPAHDITITVKTIETKDKDTIVSLEEKITFDMSKDPKVSKLIERTIQSSITCNAKKFDISPESFFFNGEPGGVLGLKFDAFDRKKETSWKLTNGAIGEQEWVEEITAHWTREATKGSDAKLGGGKLEIERRFTPQKSEPVGTKLGAYPKTEKLGITTTGRVRLDSILAPDGMPCVNRKLDEKTKLEVATPSASCELPANWITNLWFVDTVGLVQVLNSYAHMYQLVETQLK